MMNQKVVIGILAHVDVGKTTFSEGILYESGFLRNLGRVDHQTSFFDTDEMERARGMTIFSKQASFSFGDLEITLVDTPGHVDFSGEMERTLQVLDYAILMISAPDGIQAHTRTLWRVLEHYQIPTFVFVNKTDQAQGSNWEIMEELVSRLGENCVDFESANLESLAMCSEELMEEFLEQGQISEKSIKQGIKKREIFPCFFGSALYHQGIKEFLNSFGKWIVPPCYGEEFGARVFKISRDESGKRLTFLKLTGGTLKVKDKIGEEKVNFIRVYSGEKVEEVSQVFPGTICSVLGLNETYAGQGLGEESEGIEPILESVLTYQVIFPVEIHEKVMLKHLQLLEEEEPQLKVRWNEEAFEVQVQVMGEVQLEVLKHLIQSRFEIPVEFGNGRVVYKAEDTILEPYYDFVLEVPTAFIGRSMSDISKMKGDFEPPVIHEEVSILTGSAPVATLNGYQGEVLAYTSGVGRLSCTLKGYGVCHNLEEVMESMGYDLGVDEKANSESASSIQLTDEELDGIDVRTPNPVRKSGEAITVRASNDDFKVSERKYNRWAHKDKKEKRGEYLLVDGYNIIYAWKDLKELADLNFESARGKLMDILDDYQGMVGGTLILVFDAYKVQGGLGSMSQYNNIYVVYTKEAETADAYIEKVVREIVKENRVTVATSDALEQMIILGQGGFRLSANDLRGEISLAKDELMKGHLGKSLEDRNYLFDYLEEEIAKELEKVRLGVKSSSKIFRG